MLTRQQVATLETAYEILDKLRHCKAFNESHEPKRCRRLPGTL
jgi:hypothetical protein